MPSSPGGIRVNPNGQSAVVTFTLPNGGTPVAYSSRSGAGTISLPATVTTETTFWFQEQTVLTVSALVGTQQSATAAGTTAAVDLSAGGVAGLLVAVVAASGGSLVASPAPGDAGKFLAVNDTESGYALVPAPAGGLSVPDGFYEADMDAVLTVPSGQVTTLAPFDALYGEANAPVTYDGNSAWTVDRGFWFVANTYMEWETNAVGSRSVGLIMDNRYLPQKPGQFWHHELAALGLFSGGAGRVHTFPIMYMPAGAIFYFAVHQDSGGDLDISYAEIDLAVVQLDPPL